MTFKDSILTKISSTFPTKKITKRNINTLQYILINT